jgi:hypothetical protein
MRVGLKNKKHLTNKGFFFFFLIFKGAENALS